MPGEVSRSSAGPGPGTPLIPRWTPHTHEPNHADHERCIYCGSVYQKPLLVGEANPYGLDPRMALYPRPERASGHRLATLIMGMRETKYLASFERRNLCPQKWSMKIARENAAQIRAGAHDKIVLLGAKVCTAFDLPFVPFDVSVATSGSTHGEMFSTPRPPAGARTIVILPHPSGLNRIWNEPGAIDRARAALREAAIL